MDERFLKLHKILYIHIVNCGKQGEATAHRAYSSLVKLQHWILSLQKNTCPWAGHSDDDDDNDDK